MKKNLICVSVFVFAIVFVVGVFQLYQYFRVKNAKVEVVLVNDREVEFASLVHTSDFIESINGRVLEDKKIDTTSLGEKDVSFSFINDEGIKLKYEFQVEVVDTTPPVIWLSGSYSVFVGSEDTLLSDILCGDNYDSIPICYIKGDYDLNKIGTYSLTFYALDHSGNSTSKEFKLKVKKKTSPNSSTSNSKKLLFSDVVKKYKNENNKIGIDISKWQGDVDFSKLKDAGVEFVMIRVGTTNGKEGEFVLDPKFIQNIKGANDANIPVGVYFYSYANSERQAKKEARWVLSQIDGYDVDLPIAFDFEDWSNFNSYKLSFYELSNVAETFLKAIEKEGYDGMLYSSKTYLENIWFKTDAKVWLAHYTTETNYKGDYVMWQLSNIGRVDGILGSVDINVMYD